MTEEDIRYVYAAYKRKELEGIEIEDGLNPEQFRNEFLEIIGNSFDFHWTLIAQSKNGMVPVGLIFGVNNGVYIHVGSLVFFGWASNRNKLESVTQFLDEIRKEALVLWLTEPSNKIFSTIAKTKIIRRIGTVYDFVDSQYAQYQTVATA